MRRREQSKQHLPVTGASKLLEDFHAAIDRAARLITFSLPWQRLRPSSHCLAIQAVKVATGDRDQVRARWTGRSLAIPMSARA
jgi:hypothetical protein